MIEIIEQLMQDPTFLKEFGLRLKELRKQYGWSQKELAAKVGITYNLLNRYEGGQFSPPIERLPALAAALGTTLDFLLTGQKLDDARLHDQRLLRMFQELETSASGDRELVIRLIEAVILKMNIERVVKK